MEKTPHVLLAGAGANKFASENGISTVEPGSLVTKAAQQALENFKRKGGSLTEIGHKVCLLYYSFLFKLQIDKIDNFKI